MKVEILIYGYLAVCVAMIIFNIVCIFLFRHNDNQIVLYSNEFKNRITRHIKSGTVDDGHAQYLAKKLRRARNLMAFDVTLGELDAEYHDEIKSYIREMTPVFVELTRLYSHKNEIQAAYFPYIIEKYRLFDSENAGVIIDSLYELIKSPSLYSRENALHAVYSIGNSKYVIRALEIVNGNEFYHNKKLITDGLLSFTGDKSELNSLIWEKMDEFSVEMQTALMDYIRFCGGDYDNEMLKRLKSDEYDREIRFSAIRYFGKYHCDDAYEQLVKFVSANDEGNWEYEAIGAFALANYPCERTVDVLKSKLGSRVWYVRFNASQSLERLGLEYADLLDVFDGDDRYAGEMMRYRLDRKKLFAKGET